MKFVIRRGAKEIGGSCVRVATQDSCIVIDAGLPLEDWRADHRDPPPGRAFPATDKGVLDFPGLFQPGPLAQAILLSHAHADHCGLICQTDPAIKVYCSKGTSKMMKAGSLFANQSELEQARWVELKTRVPVQIGAFKVTPFNVDHSAFDSMAFLIEADGKRLLYTGDFRLHGRKPWMAQALIEGVREPRVDVMLLEGTHFSTEQKCEAEAELEAEIAKYIGGAGLVLASFSPQNVDRLVTFYKAAKDSRRTFVADSYTAYVLHVVHGQCRNIPGPQAESGIRVYHNKGFTCRKNWEAVVKKFRHSPIALDEIYKNPKRFVMVFRPSMLALDFKEYLPAETSCLYSLWHGYLERPDWVQCRDALERRGCSFAEYHTSGHVYVEDCVKFVEAIQPKLIVPIHTQAPERYNVLFQSVKTLKDGEPFEIDHRNCL